MPASKLFPYFLICDYSGNQNNRPLNTFSPNHLVLVIWVKWHYSFSYNEIENEQAYYSEDLSTRQTQTTTLKKKKTDNVEGKFE